MTNQFKIVAGFSRASNFSPQLDSEAVFLLGIFRRARCPSDTRGTLVPFYFPGGALPLKIFLKIYW
jgi:hypothetical protein